MHVSKSQYFFFNLNYNISNFLDLRNIQEQVKKAFCYHRLFWPFTVWINCSSDLNTFENSQPSVLNFQRFSRSLRHFFLTVGQNNFGNKVPFFSKMFYFSLTPLLDSFYQNIRIIGTIHKKKIFHLVYGAK